jgi:hypothetical protein
MWGEGEEKRLNHGTRKIIQVIIRASHIANMHSNFD